MQDDQELTPEQLFGYWLARRRDQLEPKVSQAALAKQLDLDPTAITKIERGHRSVRLNEAVALAEALDSNLQMMLLPPVPTLDEQLSQYEEQLKLIERNLQENALLREQITRGIDLIRGKLEKQARDG